MKSIYRSYFNMTLYFFATINWLQTIRYKESRGNSIWVSIAYILYGTIYSIFVYYMQTVQPNFRNLLIWKIMHLSQIIECINWIWTLFWYESIIFFPNEKIKNAQNLQFLHVKQKIFFSLESSEIHRGIFSNILDNSNFVLLVSAYDAQNLNLHVHRIILLT